MPKNRVATLILNRNLPHVTDAIVEHLTKWDRNTTDIFVIESGSDRDKLSQYCSFWANWPDAMKNGLRWARGFNFGLSELDKTGKRYDFYFLVMGDSVFHDQPTITRLLSVMEQYPKIGILSPLSYRFSEAPLFSDERDVVCVWLLSHVSWMVRRDFLDNVISTQEPAYIHYVYDGTNFRGYYDDIELIVKAYTHDFAAAITSRATFREQEDLTLKNAVTMKTDAQSLHWRLMYEEGLLWMRKKYGFRDKGAFKELAHQEYLRFMKRNPEYQSIGVNVDVQYA